MPMSRDDLCWWRDWGVAVVTSDCERWCAKGGRRAEGGGRSVDKGAVEGGVRSVYVLGEASGGATSARPSTWMPRREEMVVVVVLETSA